MGSDETHAVSDKVNAMLNENLTRRKAISRVGKAAIVTAVVLAVGGGGAYYYESTAGSLSSKRTLVIGYPTDPAQLNPAITTAIADCTVAGQFYRGLTRYLADPFMEQVPDLALTWESSSDLTSFTFHLVSGATWQDGQPFTSADVKYTFEQVLSKYHPIGIVQLANLVSVDTPDDQTAVIVLSQPNPSMMDWMGTYAASILPEHIYSGSDPRTNSANSNPIGLGPFIFKEWVKGDHITMTRNPNYHLKGLPYYDEVTFKIISDATTRTQGLISGELDYVPLFVSLSDANTLKSNPNLVVAPYGEGAFATERFIFINVRNSPLNNVKVRQAIASAINRDQIISLAAYGFYNPAYSVLTHNSQYYLQSAPQVMPSFSTTTAKQLLSDAGYSSGLSLNLVAGNGGGADVQDDGSILQSQLGAVGINVNFTFIDEATALDEVFTKWNFDLYLASNIGTGPDPSRIATFLTTSAIKSGVPFSNAMGYSNPTVDQLFAQADVNTNLPQRIQQFQQIQQAILTDLPVIPLMEVTSLSAWRKDIVNLPEVWNPWAGPRAGLDFARQSGWAPVTEWEQQDHIPGTSSRSTTSSTTSSTST